MTIPPISGVSGVSAANPAVKAADPAGGFGDMISKAIDSVSQSEQKADAIATDIATGGDSSIQELMVAMTEASLSMELLVQIRNKAVEAYQEIMRMQV